MEAKIRARMKRAGYSALEIEMEIREYRWQKFNPLQKGNSNE